MHILFLPRWYPNRYDPMPGLFIQQLAEALAPRCLVSVLYVHQVDGDFSGAVEVDQAVEKSVKVVRIYYCSSRSPVGIFRKIFNFSRFIRAHLKGLALIRSVNGKPDFFHVHVLTRNGVAANLLSHLSGVPYIITEHWSRYFEKNNTYRGGIRRWITSCVVRKAVALTAVSEILMVALNRNGLVNRVQRVIPNAVDMKRFHLPVSGSRYHITRFIHISCMDDRSKNISGILRVISVLSKNRNDFEVHMVGEKTDLAFLKNLSVQLAIDPSILKFEGLLVGEQLTEILRNSDASILFSHYETFGTVIIESLSSGVPVISTAVGVAPEVINKGNGILLSPGDENALLAAMNEIIEGKIIYDKEQIRQSVRQFDVEEVSRCWMELYGDILRK